jgi:hypothetical protein
VQKRPYRTLDPDFSVKPCRCAREPLTRHAISGRYDP